MAVQSIQYLIHPLGLPIRVAQWGLHGPALLLIHGLGSRCEAWKSTASRLAALGLRCIAIDTPGHGLSYKGPDFDYSAAGHARLIDAVCDELGEEKIDLAASSLGGLHAAAFTARKPERLRTLTLIGSVGLSAMTPERRNWTATYLYDMSREGTRSRLQRGVFDPDLFSEAYFEETFRMNNSAGAASSFAAISRYYAGSINDDVQLDALAAVSARVPTLLLWGKDDPTVTYDVALQAIERLPGATLVGIEGTKHMPQIERPNISARHIARQVAKKSSLTLPSDLQGVKCDPVVEIIEYRSS
jgi:pimeloyl-ACP methyl ester carboxylesterase